MIASQAALVREFDAGADVLFADHHYEPRDEIPPEPPQSLQPGWLLTLTLAGRRRYSAGPRPLTLTAGTVALRRVRRPMSTRHPSPDPWECFFVRFRTDPRWTPPPVFEQVGDDLYRTQVTPIARYRIQDAFARLAADAQAGLASHAVPLFDAAPDADQLLEREAYRQLMLLTLHEIFLVTQTDALSLARLDTRIRHALAVMSSDLAAAHSVASLARACNLSLSHFAHLFRAQLGISPRQALRLMRLRQAALRLKYSSDTVETIAAKTGFASSPHLSRTFHSAFGLSPRDFRKRGAAERVRTTATPSTSTRKLGLGSGPMTIADAG